MSTFPQAQSHEPEGKSTFLQAHSSEPGGKLTFLRGHQRWDRVPSGNSEFKCQHSQFTYSLLIKRNLPIFERVPLSWPGFEPGTFCTEGEHLINYSIKEEMKERVLKDNLYTQRSLRDRPRAQGHILSRLALILSKFCLNSFFEYLDYWKIAAYGCYFQGNS